MLLGINKQCPHGAKCDRWLIKKCCHHWHTGEHHRFANKIKIESLDNCLFFHPERRKQEESSARVFE